MIQVPQQPAFFDWLWQLFYSTDIYGILGPALLIIIGFFLIGWKKPAALVWFLVEAAFFSQYIDLASIDNMFYLNAFIILIGVIFQCIPLLTKK